MKPEYDPPLCPEDCQYCKNWTMHPEGWFENLKTQKTEKQASPWDGFEIAVHAVLRAYFDLNKFAGKPVDHIGVEFDHTRGELRTWIFAPCCRIRVNFVTTFFKGSPPPHMECLLNTIVLAFIEAYSGHVAEMKGRPH